MKAITEYTEIVAWTKKLATGIDVIDEQHKQLIILTNDLYHACIDRKQAIEPVLKDVMSRMVDYVNIHFKTEEELLKQMNYPYYDEHTIQHNELIKHIIIASNNYKQNDRLIANKFVVTLKDWIFSHIAYYDKIYAVYFQEYNKRKSLYVRANVALAH